MTNPVSNAQLAQLVNDSLAKWNAREAEHYAWVSGSATGGPNNDGRFPLSNGSGGSSLIDSPAKLASLLNGPAATAVSARDLALTYRDAAQASAASAASDRGLANNHRLAAQDHKDLAKQYRDDTAAHMATVEVWKNQVSTNTTAVAANTALTLGYRDEALAHRNAAQTARTAAEAAAALAATFNPTDYYTKTAADARYLQLTNFTWANLSGKPTTFAPSAHSHVIADVTGLQTALDAKLNLTGGTLTGNLTMNAGTTNTLTLGALAVANEPRVRLANTQWTTGIDFVASSATKGYGFFNRDRNAWDLQIDGVTTNISLAGALTTGAGVNAGGNIRTNAGSGGTLTLFETDATRTNRLIAGADASGSYFNATFGTGGSAVLRFQNANVEAMRIDAAGNVGVGTVSPTAKFHIASNDVNLMLSDTDGVSRRASVQFQTAGGNWSIENNNDLVLKNGAPGDAITAGSFLWLGRSADPLRMGTNGLERLRIDPSGNVGIGRTDPGARLDITSGAALAARISGPANVYQDITDGTGTLRLQLLSNSPFLTSIGAYPFMIGTNNTERMRVTTAGDVGIGTTSPGAKLELSGTTEQNLRITSLIDGFAATPRGSSISFRSGSTPLETARISSFNRFANFNGGNLEFATLDTANVLQTRAVIDSSGQFGIGVTPMATGANGALLQIGNPTTSPGSGLTIGSTTTADIQFSDATSGVGQYAGLIRYSHTNDIMALWTASNERMRITATGDVGIGTSTPANYTGFTTLDLNSATNGGLLNISKGGNLVGYIHGSSGLLMLANATNISLSATGLNTIQFLTNSAERMRVTGGGDVGVGTSAPGGKLEVYQTAASPTLRLFTNFVGGNAVDLNPFITGVSNGGYSVSLAGTVRYVIDTSGNFGINTTAPTQRLDVNGSALIRGGDLFIRENPSGAGTGWRLHHNGANAFTDFDGDLNFRSGDGSVSLATLTAAGFLAAADLRGASTVSAGLSGATGRVSLVSGSATQPGYIQWNTTDGVRRGYMGWSSGTNIVYQAENGWGLQINSVITTSSNITTDGIMVAKGGEITAQHNGTANTTVGIVQPGVDAMIQLGRVGTTPGALQINNTANTSYIYSAGGVLRIGGAGNVITLNNGGASFTGTVDFGATVNLNSVVNIPGGNLRVRSGGGDSAMGAYVGFRNSSDVERGWVGYGDGTSRMRVNNSIGDILVSANNNLELNGSIVRRFNAGAMIHHASSTFTSGAITVSTATPTGGADGDIWIRTAT
ncbi:MAG: hypothetical protein EAZ84_09855 [Verrucomicrobia bacterium]|nr:MAG: hypothetical protein EAZ84_09855 [Verrucomicrobiota bacterium]